MKVKTNHMVSQAQAFKQQLSIAQYDPSTILIITASGGVRQPSIGQQTLTEDTPAHLMILTSSPIVT